MGTGSDSAVTNVVLELRRGTDGKEIRRQIDNITEGGSTKIIRGSRAMAEFGLDDQGMTKEEIF